MNLTVSQSSDTSTQNQGAGESTAQDGDLSNEDPTTTTASTTSTASEGDGLPEYCSNLCPEQQVEIFMRLDIFASVYIQQDMTGLVEQLKDNWTVTEEERLQPIYYWTHGIYALEETISLHV